MKIAVIGAGGLVGQEFTRQLSAEHQVLPLTHADLDITDIDAVRKLIVKERPATIINCAVLGVDACESDPSLAWAVNVVGSEALAKTAQIIDAEIVQISSNYVFSGEREGNLYYTLEDIPAPINVYGRTKLAGEQAVSQASKRCFIVRSSWIFGNGKENFFSSVPRSLCTKKKLRAITDVWASATYVRDLVSRVITILARKHYSTYHVVNDGLCSYYDFAVAAANIMGMSDDEFSKLIEPVEISAMQLRADRPRNTPMRCIVSEKLGFATLRDWRAALTEYIDEGSGL